MFSWRNKKDSIFHFLDEKSALSVAMITMLFYFQDHDGHGPEFHKHMYRINKEAGTHISVGVIITLYSVTLDDIVYR